MRSRRRTPVENPRRSLSTRFREAAPDLLIALVAFVFVVSDLDPTGTYGWLSDGPGLTIDESFNVQQGVRLELGSRYLLLGAVSLREVFGRAEDLGAHAPLGYHLADHPPLGRYLLGVAHNLMTAVAMPADWPNPFVITAARFGSAAAFAATVLLVGGFARRRFGIAAGVTAATSLVLMPRVFGHAHLASLETMIGLFSTATVLFVAERFSPFADDSKPGAGEPADSPRRHPLNAPPLRAALIAGVLFGLALLTKVQAVLLPIPIALWALLHWRQTAIVPLAVFGATGGLVFFVGWPWLWFDPINHVSEYLGRTTDRISLSVWYLGRVFADTEVPWHYPFVLFAVTVPVGLHVLGLLGTFAGRPAGWRDPVVQLLLACLAFPLLVFAVPGVAVYDGARLFLVSFPLWAVLIGRGGGLVWRRLSIWRSSRTASIVLTLFLATQTWGVVAYRPVYLSYYNLFVGSLAGAERLGFEPTYWGDSITSDLLDAASEAVPEGGTLAVCPVLHQFQLDDLLTQSPALHRRKIRLVEYGTPAANDADALLVFERRASLPEELRQRRDEPIAEVRRQGVTLAGVYR